MDGPTSWHAHPEAAPWAPLTGSRVLRTVVVVSGLDPQCDASTRSLTADSAFCGLAIAANNSSCAKLRSLAARATRAAALGARANRELTTTALRRCELHRKRCHSVSQSANTCHCVDWIAWPRFKRVNCRVLSRSVCGTMLRLLLSVQCVLSDNISCVELACVNFDETASISAR